MNNGTAYHTQKIDKQPKREGLLTTKEAMKLLQCSSSTLAYWRNQGMPSIKIGGYYYYDKEQVQRWFRGEL